MFLLQKAVSSLPEETAFLRQFLPYCGPCFWHRMKQREIPENFCGFCQNRQLQFFDS